MDWIWLLITILGTLVVLFAIGVPVAWAFMAVNILGVMLLYGGDDPVRQLVLSMYSSVTKFSLAPVALFLLMGEVMFHSGVAFRMMSALDNWIGRIPGRLSLLAVGGGTLFATLSGSSMASTAMLGSVLFPEMRRAGYSTSISIGPVLGAGTLAIMIPPTSLGVLLAGLAGVNVGSLLMAIIVPGLLMSVLFCAYIIAVTARHPEIAPRYEGTRVAWGKRIRDSLLYVVPLFSIVFLVVGFILLGIATPNEAAATGALGCFVLAAIYFGPKSKMFGKAIKGTVAVTGMMLLIVAGSTAFSQILSFSGATQELVKLTGDLPIAPLAILIIMQIVLIIMGMFMEPLSILMVTLPFYIPIADALGFDLVWFSAIILLNMEMGAISPPFGLSLFVAKGIIGDQATMGEVYRGSLPFLALDAVVMAIMIIFPSVVLWLPNMAAT